MFSMRSFTDNMVMVYLPDCTYLLLRHVDEHRCIDHGDREKWCCYTMTIALVQTRSVL